MRFGWFLTRFGYVSKKGKGGRCSYYAITESTFVGKLILAKFFSRFGLLHCEA